MFVFYAAIIFPYIRFIVSHKTIPVSSTSHLLPISKACEVGVVAENDCNKCVCTSDYFDCIPKKCNQNVIQKPIDKVWCEPEMLYIKNVTACLCKKDGSWPHEKCEIVFNSFQGKSKNSCEPDSYVIVDCNVCKCGPDGIINKKRCTKNKCNSKLTKSRRYNHNEVYGSCSSENWYSLAPCQFCYCISENKLVCNTGHSYSKNLQLGSYNLSICGRDLIKDALNLIPDEEKTLRLGDNKTENEIVIHPFIELSHEHIENRTQKPVQEKNVKKDNEEYYTDSDETKAQIAKETVGGGLGIGVTEVSSTKLPYEEDENNSNSDSNENQPPEEKFAMNIEPSPSADEPERNIGSRPPYTPPSRGDFPQNFEWSGATSDNGQEPVDSFNLGDVLKPYLPAVLDKVFQMALRKSMVSVDPHANCTPGSTTVVKCNACFCMKNHKLLCTKNKCK